MSASDLLKVNPVLVDRVRLAIMANLALAEEPIDFNTLLLELALTKGNLSSHIRKLEEASMVETHKTFVGRKPKTSYSCTDLGRQEMQSYLMTLESVLKRTNK